MKSSVRYLTQSGVIAALYVALTLPFGELATVPFFQIRPAEALTLLPLLMPSSIWGITIGCMLVNLITSSPIDMLLGGLITLVACIITALLRKPLKGMLGTLPPILLNAFFLPLMFILLEYNVGYWYTFTSILLSQAVWVIGLGVPLYFILAKYQKKTTFLYGYNS